MIGMLVSGIYVISGVLISLYLKKKTGDNFVTRKFLHIAMASWWFIRLKFLDNPYLWIGPVVFIAITFFYAQAYNCKKGIMYFNISLAVLTFLTTKYEKPIFPSTAAILVLGYADPLAALMGRYYQNLTNKVHRKSILGSVVFTIVTSVILIALHLPQIEFANVVIYIGEAMATALCEMYLFPEYDNIVIPGIVFLISVLIG